MYMQVPLKSLLIDGNCRVEDRGLKTHHGQVSLLLSPFPTTQFSLLLLFNIYFLDFLMFLGVQLYMLLHPTARILIDVFLYEMTIS
jgi:hypothetical protein